MHPLLRRQLKKAFGDDVPAGLDGLLELVSAAYEAADDDRALLERAMDLTSQELIERNEDLNRRMAEVERAHERLEEADRWRQKFINAAAHELATPLTPIKLQMHTLVDVARDEEEFRHSVQIIERNVNRLAYLVNDLLDSAKIQSDRVALRRIPIDLAAILRMSVDSARPLAVDAGIALDVDAPADAPMVGDETRLAQVFDNLLTNAIKFTPEGGRVTVTMHASDPIQMTIKDTGVGLSPADQRQLFRPFTRLHETTHEHVNGTGLGLYVSKGIVEASGGSLEATSEGRGKGATFILSLPRQPTVATT